MLILLAALVVPVAVSVATHAPVQQPWYAASRAPTGLAPDPADAREALVQVYAARAFAWRGAFGVHTWIVVKRGGAPAFTRYDVVGWGGPPVVRKDYLAPDARWFGAMPELLLDRRGAGVDALIDRIEAAVASYPHANEYRTWPGPNSNTFTAWVARSVPELGVDLPPTAIGKDYLPLASAFAPAPSGTGAQVSLLGMLGLTVAAEERHRAQRTGTFPRHGPDAPRAAPARPRPPGHGQLTATIQALSSCLRGERFSTARAQVVKAFPRHARIAAP